MKYGLLFLFIFIFSCSQTKNLKRDLASKAMPARIVKILTPAGSSFEYIQDLKIAISLKAFKYGSSPAPERKVNFELISGDGILSVTSTKTNSSGEASTEISIKKYPTSISVKARVDNVIKNISIDVTRPNKFIGNYSLAQSKLKTSTASVIATGKGNIKFKLQVANDKNKHVDAYGLKVELIELSGESLSMIDKGNGLYEVDYPIGTSRGQKVFKAKIDGVVAPESVVVDFLGDFELVERFLIPQKTKDGTYEVLFAIKERTGAFLKSVKEINVVPVLNCKGSFSKIEYDEKQYRFKYIFYPPSETGFTQVGVKLNGKEYYAKDPFNYEYSPVVASKTKLEVEEKDILPTGIDFLNLTVTYYDSQNQIVKVSNQEQFPKFEVSGGGNVYSLKQEESGVFKAKLVPGFDQKDLKLELIYENKVVAEREFKFNFELKLEKIDNVRTIGSTTYLNGINTKVVDLKGWREPTGKVIGFDLTNDGGNEIVPTGCAQDSDSNECQATREFEFEFKDQAKQNMVMIVTDFPSDSLSKMMHGWFFFFPRKVAPRAEYSEDKSQIIMTLPTDEKVYFDAASKQIIGGVLEEGPIDLGPSRHSRKFPLIRYKGYGTVLRINARGQDARLGNWNRTKISGDFGNTGAEGVMIYQYNQSTQKQNVCYAAKKDFWPQKDINPIPFKYYSDKDFAAYIKGHCNFNLTVD